MGAPFQRALQALLQAAPEVTGEATPTCLDSWVALAARGGPTAAQGPLAFDVVMGRGHLGLNVFHNGSPESRALSLQWARAQLGDAAHAALDALLQSLDPDVQLQPGAFVEDGALRMKLYLSSRVPAALLPLLTHLQLPPTPLPVALGLDLGPEGLTRPRSYHMGAAALEQIVGLGAAAEPWQRIGRDADGLAHPLLACLGQWPGAGSKRSLVQTFTPAAQLQDLRELDRRHRQGGCPALDGPLLDFLDSRQRALQGSGLMLRPVAHETDLYPDAPSQTDVFFTFGA